MKSFEMFRFSRAIFNVFSLTACSAAFFRLRVFKAFFLEKLVVLLNERLVSDLWLSVHSPPCR